VRPGQLREDNRMPAHLIPRAIQARRQARLADRHRITLEHVHLVAIHGDKAADIPQREPSLDRLPAAIARNRALERLSPLPSRTYSDAGHNPG
jgi:hypothetical protein